MKWLESSKLCFLKGNYSIVIVNDAVAAGVCSKRISAEDNGKILSRIMGLQ